MSCGGRLAVDRGVDFDLVLASETKPYCSLQVLHMFCVICALGYFCCTSSMSFWSTASPAIG